MKTSSFLRQMPQLAVLLVSCADDGPAVGSDDSSSGSDTSATSLSASSTVADTSTGADTSTSATTTTVTSSATESSESSSASESSTGAGNAAPEAIDDTFYGVQDQPLVLDAAAATLPNDVDADGDVLTVVDADADTMQGGTVVVAVDGAIAYIPAAGFWGPDSFGYTVSDGLAEASAVVTVYVAPVLIPLASVTGGLGGFVLDGEAANDQSGFSVSGAGDVNGDGLADLVVGAYRADPNGIGSGRSYVVFGKADTDAVLLSEIAAGIGGFALDGEVADDRAGFSVSGAGDVNGDGLADVIVGADVASPNGLFSGRSYVVFGKADTALVQLSAIAGGAGGFALDGEAASDVSGRSVSGAGDVNGDGLDDLIVGAIGSDPNGTYSGRSYVVFGKADTALVQLSDITAGTGGFALDGEAADDISARSVSGAGDVDGDGLADVIVGADFSDPNGSLSGRSYVVFGKADTALVELSSIVAGVGGFALDGESADDRAGIAVSDAGDVDGDGLGDVIVGAASANPNGTFSGRSYVVFGKADTTTVALVDITAGTGGFALDGEAAYDATGIAISGAGDVNGDGLADLVLGALRFPLGTNFGRAYVVFGKADTDLVALGDPALGIGGFALDGEAGFDLAGRSVSGAGDVNGDGFADVIVGADFADPNGLESGRSYVVFGVPTGPG